jgi:hypothetical protein
VLEIDKHKELYAGHMKSFKLPLLSSGPSPPKYTVFGSTGKELVLSTHSEGESLLIFICNFHVLSHLLLIYIYKLHWNQTRLQRPLWDSSLYLSTFHPFTTTCAGTSGISERKQVVFLSVHSYTHTKQNNPNLTYST